MPFDYFIFMKKSYFITQQACEWCILTQFTLFSISKPENINLEIFLSKFDKLLSYKFDN